MFNDATQCLQRDYSLAVLVRKKKKRETDDGGKIQVLLSAALAAKTVTMTLVQMIRWPDAADVLYMSHRKQNTETQSC